MTSLPMKLPQVLVHLGLANSKKDACENIRRGIVNINGIIIRDEYCVLNWDGDDHGPPEVPLIYNEKYMQENAGIHNIVKVVGRTIVILDPNTFSEDVPAPRRTPGTTSPT